MTATLLPAPTVRPTLGTRLAGRSQHLLSVDRSDIRFHNASAEEVAIEITVRNHGVSASVPARLRLESAPLGAFVDWSPLSTIAVPAIAPGDAHVVRSAALAPPRRPLGGARGGLPPVRLRTAGDREDPGDGDRGLRRTRLPADPLAAFDLGGFHWAGNLNVFIGGRATERHMARSLRVVPGALNVAMFLVGSGRDAYRFSLDGAAAAWDAQLVRGDGLLMAMYMRRGARSSLVRAIRGGGGGAEAAAGGGPFPVADRREPAPVPLDRWIDVAGPEQVLLVVAPPAGAEAGAVDVHVRQRSTGREAVVEFGLDPEGLGPGCYVV